MRILKRNLAFVLSLVMVLGLMATANATDVEDYKDYNDITFVEAVDTLTSLGILEGEDGTFNPSDVLTREQGAKIIAYMMLGADGAKALSTSIAPYTDVAATRWSAGFIAYCTSQNIIGGYGDGTFGPTDTLTGNQFAKMLLCAVGYNVNGEFTGNNWEVEVAKVALTEGVFEDNLGANFSAGVKREEAALYAFNTLTNIMTVNYSDVFGTYYSGKIFSAVEDFNDEYTLGYKLYNLKSKASVDDFGRECHYWAQKNSKVTGNYHDAPDATYTVETKSSTMYTDLGLTATRNAKVVINGVEQNATFQIKKGLTSLTTGGNGRLIEAYADDEENVTLIVIDTYLAVVNSTDTADGSVNATVYELNVTKDFDTTVEYEDDQYVLVTYAAGAIQSMEAAKGVDSKVTTYASSYVTADKKYNKSYTLKNTVLTGENLAEVFTVDYDSEMTVILDTYGYAIGVVVKEEASETLNYVLVTGSEGKQGSLITSKAAVVEVMYLDGKTEVLPLETKKENGTYMYKVNGTWTDIPESGSDIPESGSLDINGWYSYTINSDGQIVLKALKATKAVGALGAAITFNKAQTGTMTVGESQTNLVSGLFMNSSTVYHIVTDKDTIKTTTGYKNISIAEDNANVLVVKDGSVITDLYILDSDVTEEDIYAYYNNTTYSTTKGTYVALYVNGTVVNYLYDLENMTEGSDAVNTRGIYTIEVSDGELTAATLVQARNTNRYKVTALTDLYFTANGAKHYFAEDVKMYDTTADGAAVTSIARGDTVMWVMDNNNTFVKYVYIVAAADTTTADTVATGYTATVTKTTGMTATVAVTGLKTGDAVTVKAFNYVNGINAELDTQTVTMANGSGTYTASIAGQLTLNVYVNGTLIDTFGPYSFVAAD